MARRGWSVDAGLYCEARLAAHAVRHGVSTRAWGDMQCPEREAAVLESAGLSAAWLAAARQVHGHRVLKVDAPAAAQGQEADALISRVPGVVLGVYVADCLPVFLLDPSTRTLGLIHAGWRGIRAGVVPETLAAMRDLCGTDAGGWLAAIGPHIGACCYRVSPQMAAPFRPRARAQRLGGTFLDLAEEVLGQLEAGGVLRPAVAVCDRCTCCHPDEFYSFRRDKSQARMLAFAALS